MKKIPARQNSTLPDMQKLTLGRIAKLYGMHRSTIYEAVEKGRVTATVDGKGQKVIDLSEMIRVWGEPQSPTGKPYTPPDSPTVTIGTVDVLIEELRLLRAEVQNLRESLLRIEHRPTEAKKPKIERKAESFADLLEDLDQG